MPPAAGTVFYKASARSPEGVTALFIIKAYRLGRYRAADFTLCGTQFDDSAFRITEREPTFQQQLRATGQASDVLEGDDVKAIEAKIRESYGDVEVDVERIEAKLPEVSGGSF